MSWDGRSCQRGSRYLFDDALDLAVGARPFALDVTDEEFLGRFPETTGVGLGLCLGLPRVHEELAGLLARLLQLEGRVATELEGGRNRNRLAGLADVLDVVQRPPDLGAAVVHPQHQPWHVLAVVIDLLACRRRLEFGDAFLSQPRMARFE